VHRRKKGPLKAEHKKVTRLQVENYDAGVEWEEQVQRRGEETYRKKKKKKTTPTRLPRDRKNGAKPKVGFGEKKRRQYYDRTVYGEITDSFGKKRPIPHLTDY